ncbi:hypothetical protein ABIA33_001861 [Streptacidiphilus sp. MAP12-16]|uniref:hypothetical protein n=1 Tax=Streptacidiphilus sp. MAP12-16 TaxID=3156300 RepID=UPI003514E200
MLVLGLLLLGGSAAFTTVLIADNLGGGPQYAVTLFGHHLTTLSTLGAFLAGAALALVFCVSLALTTVGARRERRRSAELRAARRERKVAARAAAAAAVTDATDGRDGTEATVLTKRRGRTLHLFGH